MVERGDLRVGLRGKLRVALRVGLRGDLRVVLRVVLRGAAADARNAALAELELTALPTSTQELDTCVRRLMKVHHPDRNPGKEEQARAKSQAILAARRCLAKMIA